MRGRGIERDGAIESITKAHPLGTFTLVAEALSATERLKVQPPKTQEELLNEVAEALSATERLKGKG